MILATLSRSRSSVITLPRCWNEAARVNGRGVMTLPTAEDHESRLVFIDIEADPLHYFGKFVEEYL